MLALWNNGIEKLSHVVRACEDPVEQRPRLVREFVQWIVTQLMHVDSCPTLSRFFTYRDCQDRMLTMKMIGMVRHTLWVRKNKAAEGQPEADQQCPEFLRTRRIIPDACDWLHYLPAHRRRRGYGERGS